MILNFYSGGSLLSLICFTTALDHPQRAVGGLYRSAKFGWNWQCSFEDMSFNVMGFGLKMPFHVPFFGLFGVKMGTAELLTVLFVYECNNLGLTSNESNSVKLVLRFSLWRKQKLG